MSDKIVTLVTYMFPAEAYPLMTQLELEGIECFLGDENIVSVQPFLSNAVGGVKVKIKECDSEKALLLLKQLTQNKKKEEKKIDEKWAKDFLPVDTYCPECESHQVYQRKFSFYKTILLAFQTKYYYCADCGHKWEQ